MIKTAVLGYGTVGSGVVEVLQTNRESIARKAGDEIAVKYVLDLREFPGDPVQEILVHDYDVILQDPEVRIVVETMGGVNPAYDFTKRALLSGRHVCTSNKELVAQHGVELMQIAADKNVNYMFEASCGGGIPIIRAFNEALTADVIDAVSGILNGTTNYILTKMTAEGSGFAEALAEAQANGYAERNPEADVEGYDACRKIAILSSVAYGSHVDFTDVYTEGITKITASDIRFASAMGKAVKLLASSRKDGNKVSVSVAPALIGPENPLYAVNDVFNAVLVHGNMLGDAMFYGSGAGSLPTASAVAADVVDCAKNLNRNASVPGTGETLEILPFEETQSRFFVRMSGSFAEQQDKITEQFGNVQTISAENVKDEFGFITGFIKEKDFAEKASGLDGLLNRIRVM